MQAFPAADGRTVYMFAYTDADPSRPSFAELLDKYCSRLPTYQVALGRAKVGCARHAGCVAYAVTLLRRVLAGVVLPCSVDLCSLLHARAAC